MRVPGADNPMGDAGVEAVVRMAATTPALKTLGLDGSCVGVGKCGSVLADGLVTCACACERDFRVRHDGDRSQVLGFVAGREPAPGNAVDFR